MSEGTGAVTGASGPLALGLAFAVGGVLGAFYFGTLWLVVRRLDRLAWPAVWLGVTGIVRLAVVVGLFALLVGTWEQLAVALAGFLVVRVVLTRRLGRPARAPGRLGRGRMVPRGEA
jgi:F1F0 ATPase subunit 2